MFHNYFRKSLLLWYNVEKFSTAGQATDENMAHAHCLLDATGYKRTLTKCNTYCFSTATMFARKRLNITLYEYVHYFSWSVFVNVVILMLCCSGVFYNEWCYNKWMLQRTIFINNIRMLQRTQVLQRKRRNTTGRRSTHVHLTCRTFPLWLKRQSSFLLSFASFSYQFSSVLCLFASLAGKYCLWFSNLHLHCIKVK